MAKLTPEQLACKQQLDRLSMLKSRCKTVWSFKNVRTLRGILNEVGYPDGFIDYAWNGQADKTITSQDIDRLFDHWLYDAMFRPFTVQNEPVLEYENSIRADIAAIEDIPIEDVSSDSGPKPAEEILPPSPKQSCVLYGFQERAAFAIVKKLYRENMSACLVNAAVGTGKTFMVGKVLRWVLDNNIYADAIAPWPILYITKSSIVEQTKRVLSKHFGIDVVNEVVVINIEQLRAKSYECYIRRNITVENGQEHETFEWRKHMHPVLVCMDECQGLKNEDSTQSKIMQAFNELKVPVKQLYFSATAFMRVCEAKCFAVATRLPIRFGPVETPLDNSRWSMFANAVAAPADPIEYCEAATKRLMQQLIPYIVDVKGVRSQFKALNRTQLVSFRNTAQAEYYAKAWEKYLKRKNKIEALFGAGGGQGGYMMQLAALTIFRKAAEYCHAENFAEMMHEAYQQGLAPAASVSFKQTIIRAVTFLIEKYGYKRDDISLIWGGGTSGPSKKQVVLKKMKAIGEDKLAELGITLEDFDLDDVEDYEEQNLNPAYRLGPQSLKERQSEIDRFQSSKTKFCFFTFKAGGVGLSLHHCDELTTYKVKRKESGWYDEADIPNCPTRQRILFATPTYSAIELVQGLGRCPRLTSMSNTSQTIFFFAGTIEARVCNIVSAKLRCLRQVVRQKESWEDCILGGVVHDEESMNTLKADRMIELDDSDDGGGIFTGDEDEEED